MSALRQPTFLLAIASLAVIGCQSGADPSSLIPSAAPARVPPPETGSYAVPNEYSGAASSSASGRADAFASGAPASQPADAQPASPIRMVSHESSGEPVPKIPRAAIANADRDAAGEATQIASATGGSIRPQLRPAADAELRPVGAEARSSDWTGTSDVQRQPAASPTATPPSKHAGDPSDLTWRAPVQW